jgi:hypothetical protein
MHSLEGGVKIIALRVAVFVAGVVLLFFSWRHAHTAAATVQNPGTANTGSPAEVLVVIGAFLALMAFVPSPETLGRWMSLKPQRRPQPAHFKRRRQRS